MSSPGSERVNRAEAGVGETAFGPAPGGVDATTVDPPLGNDSHDDDPALAATHASSDDGPGSGPPPAPGGLDEQLVGKTLGGLYRVERRIGEGGMGVVYEAEHVHLHKRYALKLLSDEAAGRRGGVERLLAEARAASRVDHPHIVDVVNLDTDDAGRLFIVMERLEGQSLRERLETGPMPLEEALEVIRQLCDALAAAHAAGIVHRDLKPANVFMCDGPRQPFAKVLDFGISKSSQPDEESLRLTTTGQLVGTPLYISPEQARGETDLDGRVDVYALGVMLFEMIAGRPPFVGRNAFELLFKHGNEAPPPLRESAPSVPAPIAEVVARALTKDRDARYASMTEFADALELARAGGDITVAEPQSVAPARRPRVVPLVVGAALVAGLAVFMARPREAPPTPTVAAEPAPTPAPETAAPEPPPAPPRGEPAPDPDVALSLRSDPPGATVQARWDGASTQVVAPATLRVPTGAAVALRYVLPGHRPAERELTAEREQEVFVRLRRRARRDPAPDTSPIKRTY